MKISGHVTSDCSYSSVLQHARLKLTGTTVSLDARLLLQAVAGITHADIIANPERQITAGELDIFNALVARRIAHEPVSRILGHREFYGRNFKITPDVLDPRADTECVVELALRLIRQGTFIDVGTGSGAIAVTLCAENPALRGIASDVSAAALAVAEANATAVGVGKHLNFVQTAWLDGVDTTFNLIISNPPYICDGTTLPPDVISFDPHLALFGGADGLNAYRELATQCVPHLAHNGYVVVEIGDQQAQPITDIFLREKFIRVAHTTDIAGIIRGLAFQIGT